jgi:hypothetical protein
MTVLRLINPAFRAGLLIAGASALIVGPLFVGAGPAAIVTGMILGILVVALALAGTEFGGRGTLPLGAQAIYDRGLALGLLVAALIFGVAGETEAVAVFAAVGAGALAVSSITSYSARPI